MTLFLLALHLCGAPTVEPPPASLDGSQAHAAPPSSPDSSSSLAARIALPAPQPPCPPLPGLGAHALRTLGFGAAGGVGGLVSGIAATGDSRNDRAGTVIVATTLGFVGGSAWGALTVDSSMERNGSVLLTLAGAVGGGLLLGAAAGPTERPEIILPSAMLGTALGATLTARSFDSSSRRLGISAWAYPGHAGVTVCGRLP